MGLLPKRIATSVKNGAGLTETSEVECKYEEPLKNPPYYHKKISSDYPSDESQEPLERWVTEKQNPLYVHTINCRFPKLNISKDLESQTICRGVLIFGFDRDPYM